MSKLLDRRPAGKETRIRQAIPDMDDTNCKISISSASVGTQLHQAIWCLLIFSLPGRTKKSLILKSTSPNIIIHAMNVKSFMATLGKVNLWVYLKFNRHYTH